MRYRKWKLVYVCFMLIIVIAGVVYGKVIEKKARYSEQQAINARNANVVFPEIKDLASVDAVFVRRRGEEYRFERSGADKAAYWKLEGRPQIRIDAEKVDSFIENLIKLQLRSEIPTPIPESRLTSYGLDAPFLAVALRTAGKVKSFSALFGREHPFSNGRYVARDDSGKLFVIENEDFLELDKSLENFRKRNPIDLPIKNLKAVGVFNPKSGDLVKLTRIQHGAWQVEVGGKAVSADTKLIESALKRIWSAKAVGFVDFPDEPFAKYGLEPAVLEIGLNFSGSAGNTKDLYLYFGETAYEEAEPDSDEEGSFSTGQKSELVTYVFKRGSSTIYRFARILMSDLLQPASHFRNRLLFADMNPEDINKLKIRNEKGEEILLQRKEIKDAAGKSDLPGSITVKLMDDEFVKQLSSASILDFWSGEDEAAVNKPRMELEILDPKWGKIVIGPSVASGGASADSGFAPRFGFYQRNGEPKVNVIWSNALIQELKKAFKHQSIAK